MAIDQSIPAPSIAAHSLRWLTALRVAAGATFLYMSSVHALQGWATAQGFQRGISATAGRDPFHWYTGFMVPLVLSKPEVFGPLFVYGMMAAGVGLIFGFLTPVALAGGLWLNANNFLMGFAGGGVHQSLNVIMIVVQLALLQTGAWRHYSLDGLLLARRTRDAQRRHEAVAAGLSTGSGA